MSKKLSLAALKQQIEGERRPVVASALAATVHASSESAHAASLERQGRVIQGRRYPTYREGKVPIGGYFSPDLSKALHQLALDESLPGQPRVKIQALIGEALDMLLRDRGKSPFGER
jgi:hypothetical protein